jgi:uncharacterized protein involved in outer membrane biogenesis
MKRYKLILIITAAILAAVAMAAYLAVRVAFPPERIGEIVRTQGSEILGRDVGVGSVRVGVFPRLKVAVRGVTLANDSGFSSEPVLSLKSLDLSISWLSLLRFAPTIHEIRLVEPGILYEVDSTGRNNLASLGSSDSITAADTVNGLPELPASVALRAFIIDNGRVRYRDAQSGQEVTLGRIDQRASLSLDQKLSDIRTAGSLTISEIAFSDKASGLRKGGVKISVAHDLHLDLPGDSVRIMGIDIAFQDVKVRVEGSLKSFSSSTPLADIHVTAPTINLASLFAEIPPEISPELSKLKVAGTASLDVRVQGVLDTNPAVAIKTVRMDIGVRDGAFGHKDVPQGIEKFTVNLAMRGDSVRLDELSFHSGPNPFKVEFLLTEVLNPVPYLRSLKVGGELDYGNLIALAHTMKVVDTAVQISGRQTFRLTASGPLDPQNPQKLSAEGRSELIGIIAQVPDLPAIQVRGIATIDNETIRQNLTVKFGNSDATVSMLVKNYLAVAFPEQAGSRRTHIGVDVKSNVIDLDELLPKKSDESIDTTAPLTAYPEWSPVDADISVSLNRTRLMNLDMTAFTLKTVLREASAVTDLKGTLYTGSFTSSVSVVPKNTTDWGFGFKLNVTKVEANDFISRLNDHVPLQNEMLRSLAGTDSALFGKFSMNMNLKTHGLPGAFADNLSGPIVFSITDGRIVGVEWTKSLSASLAKAHSSLGFEQLTFSELKGDLLAENGKLLVRDLSFDSPRAGAGRATGSIGFDNALDLQLTQALPAAASSVVAGAGNALLGQLQKFAPGAPSGSLFPTDKQGRALLYYQVGGSVSDPTFSLDAKRMATEGAGTAAAGAARAALAARAAEEKARLEAAAKAKFDSEKAKLEAAAEAEKKKLQDKAAEEVRKQGKKVLEGLRK